MIVYCAQTIKLKVLRKTPNPAMGSQGKLFSGVGTKQVLGDQKECTWGVLWRGEWEGN